MYIIEKQNKHKQLKRKRLINKTLTLLIPNPEPESTHISDIYNKQSKYKS